MSGHNKWSQIKRKKGAEDERRSKVFSLLVKNLTRESKMAGGNKEAPGLRTAIEKARASNMPAENIERAIAKGIGEGAESYETVTYEGYGPAGVAIIVKGLTDSPNRTSNEIKHIFSKNGGSFAAQGAAMWAFTKGEAGLIPNMEIVLTDKDGMKLAGLIEELEDQSDVENVYTNAA